MEYLKKTGLLILKVTVMWASREAAEKFYPPATSRWALKGARRALNNLRAMGIDPLTTYFGSNDILIIAKKIRELLVTYLSSGPIFALRVEGPNATHVAHKMVGSTCPSKARRGSIRGDLSKDCYDLALAEGRACLNVAHGSANKVEATRDNRWVETHEKHRNGDMWPSTLLFEWLEAAGYPLPRNRPKPEVM